MSRSPRAVPVVAPEQAARGAGKRIIAFLCLTLVFTAVSASLAIGLGTGGDAGDLIALAVMWSPGLAALVTLVAFQRNVRGIGWQLGRPRYLLIGYALPLVECSVVYGLVWTSGLGALRGDLVGVGQTLVAVTPGLLTGIVAALGEEIGWRGLLVPQLARLTTFTRTALISGAVQAVWHWPFVLFAGFQCSPLVVRPQHLDHHRDPGRILCCVAAASVGQRVAGRSRACLVQPVHPERLQSAHPRHRHHRVHRR
jgi:membrane protease YdiL (CAAX protease family)